MPLEFIKKNLTRFTNKDYLEAAVAAAWLVGIADQDFDQDERSNALKVLQANETLKAFTSSDISKQFTRMGEHYGVMWGNGNREAEKSIRKLADAPEEQKYGIMVMAFSVGEGNGQLKDVEKVAIARIVRALGVRADDYQDFGVNSRMLDEAWEDQLNIIAAAKADA